MLRAIVIRTASAKATLLSTRKPGAIRSDNGPEFIARAVRKWLAARKVGSLYIAPGSPWENEYSESFNSRMKAEFADLEMFGSLLEAKVLGAEYKTYWNQERLHSGIGYQTPAEFAAELGPDPSSITTPTDSHKHWYIKWGQASAPPPPGIYTRRWGMSGKEGIIPIKDI